MVSPKLNRCKEMSSPMRRNTRKHKRFRHKLSSSGVRRQIDNKKKEAEKTTNKVSKTVWSE